MPIEYSNPNGRWKHDDWTLFKDTPRILTARRPPLPFRMDEGVKEQRWILWDATYPRSPGLQVEDRTIYHGGRALVLPHALVDCAVEGEGEASFSAFLDGQWVPCYKQYRKKVFGRLLAWYSGGLKQDLTVGINDDFTLKVDILGWIDPPTCSWNKVT